MKKRALKSNKVCKFTFVLSWIRANGAKCARSGRWWEVRGGAARGIRMATLERRRTLLRVPARYSRDHRE